MIAVKFISPYAYDKNFWGSILVATNSFGDEEWVAIQDGDTCFLVSDWGHQISEYAEKYQDYGLLVALGSRTGSPYQHYNSRVYEKQDNLRLHINIAQKLRLRGKYSVKPVNHEIAGFLMVLKVGTLRKCNDSVLKYQKEKGRPENSILGVDRSLAKSILDLGLKVGVMEEVYMLHIYRLGSTKGNKHLQ